MNDKALTLKCRECGNLLTLFTVRCGIILERGGIWLYYYCECGMKYQIDWITSDGVADWYPLTNEVTMEELSKVDYKVSKKGGRK